MAFENLSVDITELPDVQQLDLQKPDPAFLRVSFIGLFIFLGIMLAGVVGIIFLGEFDSTPWLKLLLPGIWLFFTVLSSFLTYQGYKIQGYALREKDVVFRRGVIFRSLVTVPFNRIQHCEIKEGPVERLFGLKTLQIFTAGGMSSDISIPGLKGENAPELKDFIIKATGESTFEDE
ncbi:MAG: PH domain-containing protein [Bacteroidota bacterium]